MVLGMKRLDRQSCALTFYDQQKAKTTALSLTVVLRLRILDFLRTHDPAFGIISVPDSAGRVIQRI
jgi:hypothetical protein